MTLVDSHCHLDDERFDGDRDEVIGRALEAGVERMLAIGTGGGPPDLKAAIRLADRYDCVWATVGVHPHDAAKAGPETAPGLAALARRPKVLAIGEIGLDYHYDFSPREVQQAMFRQQLELARRSSLPVIIHTREAWPDTMAILGEYAPMEAGGVMHCFSGGPAEARASVDLGFHLSFGGLVTFPKAESVRAAARETPLERLLVETDAPYLAPAPHRGKRNEPAFLVATTRRLAEARSADPEEIAEATTANFLRLFGSSGRL